LFGLLLLLPIVAKTQDPSSNSLLWILGQGKDLRSGQSFEYTGSLVTGAGEIITWTQKSLTTSFQVTGVSGAWEDTAAKGQLTYAVSEQGATGTITIGRDAKGVYVSMEFPKGDPQGTKVRWNVISVSAN
jgi:hypothetical protein